MLFDHCAFAKKPCPKCGMIIGPSLPRTIVDTVEEVMLPRTHSTEYCDSPCDQIRSLLDTTKNKNRKHFPEHLHKRCLCCGWEWLEDTHEATSQFGETKEGVQ